MKLSMPKNINYSAYAPVIALLVLVLCSALASDHFLLARNITNVLRQVSYTGIIALGMTFVIIAGGIDLSVGSMLALVGVLLIYVINAVGDGVTAVMLGVAAALALGVFFGSPEWIDYNPGQGSFLYCNPRHHVHLSVVDSVLQRRW